MKEEDNKEKMQEEKAKQKELKQEEKKKRKENKAKKKEEKKLKKYSLEELQEKQSAHEILKKAVSRTLYFVIMLLVIIALYIGINLLVEYLNPSDIDLTEDQVYSLSDTSKQIAQSIDEEVQIIIVNMSDYTNLIDFAYRYTKENDLISVLEIEDIDEYPEIANEYSLTSSTYKIILECGDRSTSLTTDDLYTYEYSSDYTSYEYKDLTEEAITNALIDVTTEDKPNIYFLTGHSDSVDSYMYDFKESLEDEANEVEDLDLLTTGEIPEDCDVLVITTLDEDISEMERDLIIEYIEAGGEIAIFQDANYTEVELTNYQKVLDEYGVSVSEGVMIETDTSQMLANTPLAILINVEAGTSVTEDLDMTMSACFIYSGKLTFEDSDTLEELGVEYEVLASTSSGAFYRSDFMTNYSTTKSDDDEEGIATVGALVTKTIDDETTSKLIIYANNLFITSYPIQLNSMYYYYAYELYNNEDLGLNSIAYLTGRDDIIMLRKDTDDTTYTITEQQETIILTIIFSVPVITFIIGIIVWQVRRRKK